MKQLKVDDKFTIEYDDSNNDMPKRVLRHGEVWGRGKPFSMNWITAMFYALLEAREGLERFNLESAGVKRIKLMSTDELKYPDKVAPATRAELLEYVNRLNMDSSGFRYWTCTVLYNTVIWKQFAQHEAEMFAVYEGVLK